MDKLASNKNIRKGILYSLGLFLILLSNTSCGSLYPTNPTFHDNTNCSLSRTKGQTHKYFSARIIVTGSFIRDLQVISVEGLPPGIKFNATRNVIEGTPSSAGFWSIKVKYRDRNKGVYSADGHKATWHYYKNFEISIYDKLN